MSASISNNDSALRLLLALVPQAESELAVQTVTDQLSKLDLDGQTVEGTNSVAQLIAAKYNSSLAGKTDAEKADVSQWLTMSARHGPTERQLFAQTINEHLADKTYLVSNALTLADIVAFSNVHAYMDTLSSQKRFNWSNFSRWFDLIQHTVPAAALEKAGLRLIAIDLNAPAPAKKQQAAPAAKADKANKGAAAESDKKGKKQEKAEGQKEKKEKKKQPAPAAKEELKIVPSMIDLRVGHIVNVKKHEDADSLYVETIELGEPAPRTVVSGLVRFIPIEQMQDRDVVLVCNLKPVAMRGVKSFAMVLCATSPDGNTVEFVEPPKGSKPGDRVYFEGFEGAEPEEVLKPKLKIFETIQPGLFTNDDREAGWYDENKVFHKLLVGGNVCTTATVAKGTLK
ncbi:G4 quadruplex nucleic acid binding protein [Coemansia interrupta]|uniref:G4 quadruplex nucleic acid binding protein n=1 Tax=Coemansia interrupta TaxID=1126814 RepID=A0A9W8HKV7_9FUNG|nr:G4 quadruplex nucleic acid binding protein [Coemansia interrupta]